MKRYFLLLMLSSLILNANGQSHHIAFDHLNVANGLPEGNVQQMCQDKLGYLWVATQAGLVRYNGYETKVYSFYHKNSLEFSQNIIFSVFQDTHRDLWAVSADRGLFRYDRRHDKFVSFFSPSLNPKVKLAFACPDSAGNVWSAIANSTVVIGVERYDPRKNKFFRYDLTGKGKFHLVSDTIQSLHINLLGDVLVGTPKGQYVYEPRSQSFIPYPIGVSKAVHGSFYAGLHLRSDHHTYWLMQNSGISRYDDRTKKVTKYKHDPADPNSLANDTITDVYEDKQKRLWASSASGLSLYNDTRGNFTNYTIEDTVTVKNKHSLMHIYEDNDGKLWFTGYGIIHFDPQTLSFDRYIPDISDPTSIANGVSQDLLFDHANTLWIGRGYNGVDHVDRIKSAFYMRELKLPAANTLATGLNNTLLIGTKNGVIRYDKKTGRHDLLIPSKEPRIVLGQGKDGKIYLTDFGGNFLIYDPFTKKTSQFKHNDKDPSTINTGKLINNVLQDHTGIVWIGTGYKGMSAYDPKTQKFKNYPFLENNNHLSSADKLDDSYVEVIYQDHEGNIFAGTNAGGLNYYDRKHDRFVSSFVPTKGVGCVISILKDHSGRLWAGTYINGLFLLDNKTLQPTKHFDEKNGLTGIEVDKIIDTRDGYIWTMGPRGLSRIDTHNFSIRNFYVKGMPWQDIIGDNSSLYVSAVDTAELKVDVLGHGQIVTVDLKSLPFNAAEPITHIETITYNDPLAAKTVDSTVQTYGLGKLELPHDQNRLTFKYVALDYQDPNGIRYVYKLDGYDHNWVVAGTQRTVTYTNLAPGTYTFTVKARNSDGVWNKKGDSITVIIASPWWVRWWAWLLYTALFGAALYAFITYRSRQLTRANKLLEEKVTIRTKQLHEQQEEITAQRDQLSDANREMQEQQEEITAQRDQLSESLNQLKQAQRQLVQSEKLASLGELTAGIAHEIQNPLNFVNNFSEVSVELMGELNDELDKGDVAEARIIANDVVENLVKIKHHGGRADNIVKSMLEHSRISTRQKEPTDINKLVDEYLRLAYHGLRAKDRSFNAEMVTDLQADLPKATIVAQDIARTLLNLFNNAFYAVQQKQRTADPTYKPTVTVTTFTPDSGGWGISVADNGTGIPQEIRDKIMQPFFTTKPTGEGTGLGLSLSYDIIVNGHGGRINVESAPGDTVFTIMLPADQQDV